MHPKLFPTLLLLLSIMAASAVSTQAQTMRGLYVPDNNGGTRPAQNEKRIALVIGNQSYQSGWQPLNNPVNDANALETALKQCGFEVTKLTNTTRSQLLDGISNFTKRISGSETVALFAYAGHGIEADGKNYLIPTDDASRCREDIAANAIDLDLIHKKMNNAGAAMKIMIVDACRNNPLPFTCPTATRSAEAQSFVQYIPKGTYVAFSTAPGYTASDGTRGANSPYVDALVKALKQDGLTIEQVFKQVRRQLDKIGQQTWDNNGYTGDFYFKPAQNNVVVVNPTPAPTPTPPATTDTYTEDPNGLGIVMQKIQGGTFTMGSTDTEASYDEKPTHSVTLDDFYMGKYEVTLAQFKAFVKDSGYKTDAEKEGYSWKYTTEWVKMEGINWRNDAEGNLQTNEQHPVIHVSWNDAMEYCKWLSRKTGKSYTLPTEAQWEYAAGNGSRHTKYAWGNGSPTNSKGGNVADETAASKFNWAKTESNIFVGYTDGYATTAPVGQFGSNDFGLYDMTGNVWEWCRDWYAADYYSKSPNRNPENTTTATYRVLRGGSWFRYPQDCRAAYRSNRSPSIRNNRIGFRLVFLP